MVSNLSKKGSDCGDDYWNMAIVNYETSIITFQLAIYNIGFVVAITSSPFLVYDISELEF